MVTLKLRKANKYGSRKSPCRQLGTKCKKFHDSKAEADYCDILAIKERAGVLEYWTQVEYIFEVNGFIVARHIVDFQLSQFGAGGGAACVIDVKGKQTADWAIKYKLFRALYPQIPYTLVRDGREVTSGLPKLTEVYDGKRNGTLNGNGVQAQKSKCKEN